MKCCFGCGHEAVEGSRICEACKELAFALYKANNLGILRIGGRLIGGGP